MIEPDSRSIAEMMADNDLITNAINRAVREAVLMHARAGHPVATWRDGQVVWIPPEEILARFASDSAAPSTDQPVKPESPAPPGPPHR